jgi:uncharacterized delta-60 repeat protein
MRRVRNRLRIRVGLESLDARTLLSTLLLDPTFGSGGRVVAATVGTAPVLAIQSDQKILEVANGGLERFLPDGSVDSSFGTGGIAAIPQVAGQASIGGSSLAGIALQADGKIVLAEQYPTNPTLAPGVAVERLNADGSVDSSFKPFTRGNSGIALELDGIAALPNGNILVESSETSHLQSSVFLSELESTGDPNVSFGVNGEASSNGFPLFDHPNHALAIQPDGDIVIAGLARFAANGTLDTAFPRTVGSTSGNGVGVVVQPDGKVVALLAPFSSPMLLVRLNADGTYDNSFGNSGVVPLPAGSLTPASGPVPAADLALEPNGEIVVAVTQTATMGPGAAGYFSVSVFRPNGSLDALNSGSQFGSTASAVAVQPDGKILVSGSDTDVSPVGAASLWRFQAPSATTDPNAAFVAQLYADLLDRLPDTGGLGFWTGALDHGNVTRGQVVSGFVQSTEYRTAQIGGYYQAFLRRAASSSDVNYWLSFMQSGGTLRQVETAVLSSAEFFGLSNTSASNDTFLNNLYLAALGRPVDSAGQAVFGRALASGVSRSVIVTDVLTSQEAETYKVEFYYADYLHRAADPGGLAHWLAELPNGKSNDDPMAGILSSQEYFQNL